ncbi:MAG: hypothetical protein R3192_08840 [Woeseiaceae bacterium]|nr:hypothetical protein [Woeseiaceae bacterium]
MLSSSRLLNISAVLAVFVVFDYLYWIVLFGDFLGVPDMGPREWIWFHSASAVMAICFVVLFERGWPESGTRNGAIFGLIAGTFWGIGEFMSYAQGSGNIIETLTNCLGDIGMFVIAGVVLGSIGADGEPKSTGF